MDRRTMSITIESAIANLNTASERSEIPARRAVDRLCVRNPARIETALSLLLDASVCAQDVGVDPWQFSVELGALRRLGVTANECRWLVAKGFVKHACEITTPEAARRGFQPCANLAFPRRTC